MAGRSGTALVLACLALTAQADAQSLGDIALRTEAARRDPVASTTVFDDRDLNPEIAREELLQFTLDDARWRRYLAADRLVSKAFKAAPSALDRLERLQASSVRALERFFQREAGLHAALTAAGADPHEYAFTQLAVGLALAARTRADDSNLPEAIRANVAFVARHAREVKGLAVPPEPLALRIVAPPAPAAGAKPAAGDPYDRPSPAPSASGSVPAAPDIRRELVRDFDFVDFNGTRRRLSDYRGRYVLLDFWGVWCPNCRAEVPYLKDAYSRFQSRGLEIIGMDYEKSATVEEVRRYLILNGITWPFARPDSVRDVIMNQFQIDGFPTQLLVDPEGSLVDVPSGAFRGERLAVTLDRLLPR
jgi:thiol-disulfide isomerase/thioredoxin